ncbi:MAG TPA: ABC transporter substrate-binding protein [Chloroflexota bacterium]|nr:ABC transporter substrate-binding protein [Chloroflexota bacterium]
MASNQEHSGSSNNLYCAPMTRRQALGTLAAGVGGVALGIDALEVAKAAGRPRAAIHGEFHSAWPYFLPPTGHYNTYDPSGNAFSLGIYQDLMEMPPAMYYWADKKWLWLMATSGKYDGSNYVLNLRKGARWSDGSAFTAQDVIDNWSLWHMLGNDLFSYVDKITAPNDHTVVFHMAVLSNTVERYILHQSGGQSAIRAHSVYGNWAKRFRDLLAAGKGINSPEVKALRAQFVQFRPTSMVVTGPFQIDPNSITQSQMTLIRNPNSWAANLVGFERIINYNGETNVITPVVLAGNVDYATHGFPLATDREFVAKGFTVIRPPCYYGFGLVPNFKKIPALNNKVARQALMYMIDRKAMGPVVEGPGGFPDKYVSGMSDALLKIGNWVDPSTLSKFNTYPYDPKKGVSMLESIGWKKGSDGVFVTPDGQKATWEILAAAEYVDQASLSTNFADQLAPYGFKLKVRTVSYPQVFPLVYAGNFDLVSRQFAAADPHPHFSYDQDISQWIPPITSGVGSGYNPVVKTAKFGTVDLLKAIRDSALGLDANKQRPIIAKLAQIFNDEVPFLTFVDRYGGNPTLPGKRVAGWPPLTDKIYQNSPYADSFVVMMLLTGQLHAV